MVRGLVMIAGVVGACPRNGREVRDEMVVDMREIPIASSDNGLQEIFGESGRESRELYLCA